LSHGLWRFLEANQTFVEEIESELGFAGGQTFADADKKVGGVGRDTEVLGIEDLVRHVETEGQAERVQKIVGRETNTRISIANVEERHAEETARYITGS
jgi:uncharacterized protein YidB (DUF937 family)